VATSTDDPHIPALTQGIADAFLIVNDQNLRHGSTIDK